MYSTREEWLTAALAEVRPIFETAGHPPAQAIRVTCGFPSNARRTGALGECWADTASADRTMEILVSPVLADPVEVLAVLLHEVAHTTPGAMNHGAAFAAAAGSVGLKAAGTGRQPWKATALESPSRYVDILEGLGSYPHATLTMNGKAKQATLMLKAQCPTCGYTVRLTRKWANLGLPVCPQDGDTFALEAQLDAAEA